MKKNAFVIALYLVVMGSFSAVCFLAVYYVPTYKELFRDMGIDFSLITMYTIHFSDTFATNSVAAVALGVVIITAVWAIPSMAIKTVCFSLLLLVNTFLGIFLYGGIQLTILHRGNPNSIFVYVKQRMDGKDTTTAYKEMVEDAKSPEFVHKLDDPPLIFLSKGIHAMVEAKNEKAAAFINTTLHRYLWEPAEFHQEPSPIPMPQLREILFTGIYGLYKINGEYPEEVSKKLEVYADSERFSLLARFICHDKRVLHDLLKYYPVDFVNNFATWSPQTVAKDSQPQVDFKDVSSHDMLKYIREATYIIPQYK